MFAEFKLWRSLFLIKVHAFTIIGEVVGDGVSF